MLTIISFYFFGIELLAIVQLLVYESLMALYCRKRNGAIKCEISHLR